MPKSIDLTGKVFARLTVLGPDVERNDSSRWTHWLCQCSCGNIKSVDGGALRSGRTRSCGCLRKEVTSSRRKVHGMSKDPVYLNHKNRRRRCDHDTPSSKYYKDKGIKVCDEWKSYATFCEWVQSTLPEAQKMYPGQKLELDRIDYNNDYSPENCRWVTREMQAENRSNSLMYKDKCLAHWCRDLGLNYTQVRQRVKRLGWTIPQALELESRENVGHEFRSAKIAA